MHIKSETFGTITLEVQISSPFSGSAALIKRIERGCIVLGPSFVQLYSLSS